MGQTPSSPPTSPISPTSPTSPILWGEYHDPFSNLVTKSEHVLAPTPRLVLIHPTARKIPIDHWLLAFPSPSFHTVLHFYYAVYRALLKGSRNVTSPSTGKRMRRAALPVELAILIVRCAQFAVQSPISTKATFTPPRFIDQWSEKAKRQLVAIPTIQHTLRYRGVFEEDDINLARLIGLRVRTLSKDQGWVSDEAAGNWTWFEVTVLDAAGNRKMVVNEEGKDEEAVWESHHNKLASKSFKLRKGRWFEPTHELWRILKLDQGDQIAVNACARYPGWTNEVQSVSLDVWLWWK